MSSRHRPHPHLAIPPGAAPPSVTSSQHADDWDFLLTSPENDTLDLWNEDYRHDNYTPSSARSPQIYPIASSSSRSSSRPASVYETSSPRLAFPEPHPYRSPLRMSSSHSHLGHHRSAKSESHVTLMSRPSQHRGESRPPSFISTESSPEVWHPSSFLPSSPVCEPILFFFELLFYYLRSYLASCCCTIHCFSSLVVGDGAVG